MRTYLKLLDRKVVGVSSHKRNTHTKIKTAQELLYKVDDGRSSFSPLIFCFTPFIRSHARFFYTIEVLFIGVKNIKLITTEILVFITR